MNNVTLRVELGISAQQITSQLMMNNKDLETQIEAGINKALDELIQDNNFVDIVANTTKESLENMVKEAVHSWELRRKIEEALRDKLTDFVEAKAEAMVERLLGEGDVA